MSVYFKPYEGSRPFLFISYSHRDSRAVLDTISVLNERRLRLWYDEGIPAGSDWPKNIQQHMQSCATVLFFLSRTALSSANCRSEIETALALKKPVLVLPLEATEPSEEWRGLLARCEALPFAPDSAARAEKVLACRRITRAHYRRPLEQVRLDGLLLVFALLLFAAAAAGLYGLVTGRLDPYVYGAAPTPPAVTPAPSLTPTPSASQEPTPTPYIPGMEKVTFPDSQQERAVRDRLNRPEGDITLFDLGAVRELHFCGTMTLEDLSQAVFSNGVYTVNGAKPLTGFVADLSVIGRMPYLTKLSLIAQPTRSLAPLNRLVLLEELSLAADANADLSTLPVLPSLRVLHLEHSGAADLSSLLDQPALEKVTVSVDMLPLAFSDDAAFDVVLVP